MFRLIAAAAVVLASCSAARADVRIKDITDVGGARGNQLFGFGLVVGLDQTGSRSTFTQDVAVQMLQRMNYTTGIVAANPAESIIRSTSISAVLVTAEIGPFNRKGARIDVTVSAIDDARSLQGGTLIFTPLRGADGNVYALAQGPLSVGGFSVTVGGGGGVQKNHLNVGRIPGGGIIEKEAPGELVREGKATLLLRDPDFNTARLIAKTINTNYPGTALASDPGAVILCQPADPHKTVTQFLAEVGLLEIKPDQPARIVINERTGTVVAGEHVSISTTAVAHGNLYIGVSITPVISQPAPFSGGTTVVAPRIQAAGSEQQARLIPVPKATTVAEVARTLNAHRRQPARPNLHLPGDEAGRGAARGVDLAVTAEEPTPNPSLQGGETEPRRAAVSGVRWFSSPPCREGLGVGSSLVRRNPCSRLKEFRPRPHFPCRRHSNPVLRSRVRPGRSWSRPRRRWKRPSSRCCSSRCAKRSTRTTAECSPATPATCRADCSTCT